MKAIAYLLWLPFIVCGYLAGLAFVGVHCGWVNAMFHAQNFLESED